MQKNHKCNTKICAKLRNKNVDHITDIKLAWFLIEQVVEFMKKQKSIGNTIYYLLAI